MTKLEFKMNFFFRNTEKDIKLTEEDEEHDRKNKLCWFCEKKIEFIDVRELCHLTGKYRSPAHENCNVNVKQKQSSFFSNRTS